VLFTDNKRLKFSKRIAIYFFLAGIAQIVILKLPLKYSSAELNKNLLLTAGGFLLVGIAMGQSSHHFA
jgi:hypothetical protein